MWSQVIPRYLKLIHSFHQFILFFPLTGTWCLVQMVGLKVTPKMVQFAEELLIFSMGLIIELNDHGFQFAKCEITRGHFTLIPLLFHYYSINIPVLFHYYSINIPVLFHCYSTNIPLIFHCYSINIPWIFHYYSVNIPWIFHWYSIHTPLLFHYFFINIPLTHHQ